MLFRHGLYSAVGAVPLAIITPKIETCILFKRNCLRKMLLLRLGGAGPGSQDDHAKVSTVLACSVRIMKTNAPGYRCCETYVNCNSYGGLKRNSLCKYSRTFL